ncbi:hypothetical protein [Mariniluteicoccus flavus]
MTNRLASHLTTWKWWYAVLTSTAFLLSGGLAVLAGFAPEESRKAASALLGGVQFVAFAALALAIIALLARKWPTTQDRRSLPGQSSSPCPTSATR